MQSCFRMPQRGNFEKPDLPPIAGGAVFVAVAIAPHDVLSPAPWLDNAWPPTTSTSGAIPHGMPRYSSETKDVSREKRPCTLLEDRLDNDARGLAKEILL